MARKRAGKKDAGQEKKLNKCPFRAASHRVVFAAGIAEVAAFRAKVCRFDTANHDKMRHDTLCLGKTAVGRRGRASQHRSAGCERGPFAARESFAEMVTGTAGEKPDRNRVLSRLSVKRERRASHRVA